MRVFVLFYELDDTDDRTLVGLFTGFKELEAFLQTFGITEFPNSYIRHANCLYLRHIEVDTQQEADITWTYKLRNGKWEEQR